MTVAPQNNERPTGAGGTEQLTLHPSNLPPPNVLGPYPTSPPPEYSAIDPFNNTHSNSPPTLGQNISSVTSESSSEQRHHRQAWTTMPQFPSNPSNQPALPTGTAAPPPLMTSYNQYPQVASVTPGYPVSTSIVRYPQSQPSDHLALSMLVLFFCCAPVGIIAVVKSFEVRNRYKAGDYHGAERASSAAKFWIKIGMVFGIVINSTGVIWTMVNIISSNSW